MVVVVVLLLALLSVWLVLLLLVVVAEDINVSFRKNFVKNESGVQKLK